MLIFAFFIGLIMTWSVGANDLANVMSTSIGSKAITVRQAIIIAIIFEFAGAFLGGQHVSSTMRNGIINTDLVHIAPQLLAIGMLAVLLAATTWMLTSSFLGMPVSITHTVVGGLIGFAILVFGLDAVHWNQISYIAASWICSPAIASIFAYTLFRSVQRLIFETRHPAYYAKRYFLLYLLPVSAILTDITVIKGLQYFHVAQTTVTMLASISISTLVLALIGYILMCQIPFDSNIILKKQFIYVEKLFSILMGLTACAMVFAHGSNDIPITVSPIAAIISTTTLNISFSWLIIFGCTGVILGLLMYGRKVIATVGTNITQLTPSRAFSATLAAAITIIVSTGTGIPVSSTQTLVGAVFGVGLARGLGALNLNAMRNIFMSWAITLPVTSLLAMIYYYGLNQFQ